MSEMGRYDLHTHSWRSYDSLLRPRAIVRAALARGLAGIAITDHEAFGSAGAVRVVAPPDLLVIAGMEIYTEIGDIVCIFLTDEIRARDAREVISQAHDQGGLAFLPHPLRGHPPKIPTDILDALDGYEGLNSRAGAFDPATADASGTEKTWSRLAAKARLGNSDAHFASEIGMAYTLIRGRPDPDLVRESIIAGQTTVGGSMGPSRNRRASQIIKLVKSRDPKMVARFGRRLVRRISRSVRRSS